MKSFLNNISSVLDAIDLCIERRLNPPAIMLIYSCIDILGSLEREKNEGTQASFVRWVDKYLLKAKHFDCTALELFAARCALLHTLTPDSDLFRQGRVRRISYVWGTAKVDDLKATATLLKRNDVVALHLKDLREALRLGILAYLKELENDTIRMTIVKTNAEKSFDSVPSSLITDFLSNTG